MVIKTGSDQLDFLMTVTLSGCRMSDRYWRARPPGPDPGGSDPGGYSGRFGGGGNPEEGSWQGPYGPSRDPFSRQLGLLIPSEGGRSSSGAVSGSFRASRMSTPSERGRSDPWARGDPGATASRAGGAGPWTGYEARSGSAYSARGVAPMDPDDPMMSCLPSGRSSRGGESLPRTQSHGSSGTVPSFDPLARAADLLQNANFLDGQGRVTLPATRDKRDKLLETLLLGLSEVESRRSHQDNPSRREESLGGGGGGAPGPMSGPMATFSDSRGGGSFLGTRPPWEESSGRFSSPDQSPNFGKSPEFSQGSTRPPIFYQGSDSFRSSESYSSGRGQHPPGFWVPPEGGSAENIALDCKVQELIRAFHSVKQEVQAKQEQDQAFYQRWRHLGSDVEPFVSEFGGPPLERLRSRSPDLGRPETPESGRRPPEAAASREQPSSTFSRGGVPERESARAYYDLAHGGAGQPSSPPHPTMGEARRRRFGDRGSAPWEDPYSHLLGTPVEPSAGNFLQTMGARRQELYQQGASGSQRSGPLSPGQGQVHRDPEPQGGGQLRGSPVQVVCAGAVPPGLPHTVVLPSVSAPEPAGSKPRTRKRQKKKKKSAAQKAEERADKECWRCRQLGHYEVDCPQPAAEPMETAHGDASEEVTPMEVSPGPSEPGRPVEEPASSSLETSSRPVAAGTEEGQSREERARQAARARVATAHRSQRDMAGVSLDQTLSSVTGRGLTVEAMDSSDSRGSGRAGQLSVLKLAAATRRPGSRSESHNKGRRRARSLTREVPTSTAPAPLVHQYDGDARAMYHTLKWHVELLSERGGYLGVIGRRREQKWYFCDLAMGTGTRQMTQEYIEDLCSDLPPVVSSKEEVVLEEPPPSQRDGDASGVTPGGRLSPVSPHEDRLLDSDAAAASGRSGQASGPAQDRGGSEKTQASPSSTMSRATPDYSRCPYSNCRFVENRSHKLYEHAMVHLPRYVFREVFCFVCTKAFSNKTVCANHIRQQHKMEPEAADEQYFFLIGSLLLHLASVMCPADADLNGLLDHAIRLQREMGGHGFPVQPVNASNSSWSNFLAHLKVPAPKKGFSTTPLNSVAALLHWRVLLVLGSFLRGGSQDVFRNWLAEASWDRGVPSGSAGASGQLRAVHGSYSRAHLDQCQRELLKGTGRCPPAPAFEVVMAYGRDDYLTDVHFHFHQVVSEVSRKKCHLSVKLESLRSKYDVSGVQPTNLPLGIAVDNCMISPEGRLPGTRAEEGSVLQAFGAHPSVVMDWDEKAHLEGVAELCSRLRTEAARVVAVGEIGIDTLVVKSTAQLDRRVAFLTALVKALMESSDLKHLPLVLHVREGDNTRRASSTCITILKDAGVPQNHKVYRHSFLGDYQEAQDWLRAFPNVMFGVCPLSLLRPVVKPVLLKVAWDRLLVETDAPFQRKAIHDGPRPSIHVTSPFHIALVYRWLACVKQAATVG